MPNVQRSAIVLAVLIVFGGVAWYVTTREDTSPQSAFFAEGNLVRNNPGLVMGVWHLAYEEPGFPGLTIPLRIDAESRCMAGREVRACDSLLQGDRVQVRGARAGNEIIVHEIIFTNPTERNIPIKLFYYDPKKDVDGAGNILCSARGLVAVERVLPYTTVPLAEAIKLLLRGEISDEEKAAGVTSEFPLFGVRLESATIANGVATLRFSDEQNKTGGGSCRVSILRAQIEETAKQFPTVKDVRILPEELFQP